MKKSLMAILSGFVLLAACSSYVPSGEIEPGYGAGGGYGEISIGFFYDYLSPFGTWVEFSPYGYVWCPQYLGFGWRPYYDGRWVWTDFGWTWLSDYEWGWVPFHYGRWDWDDGLGWFWVPDTIWGPAWVTWDWDDAYIGWAPLPPWVEFSAGIGISRFSRPLPARYWSFVQGPHFLDPRVRNYIMPPERNETLISRSVNRTDITVVNNRIYNGGVGTDEVRRVTRHEVPRYRLEDASDIRSQKVESGTVRIYRPPVQRVEAARPKSFVLKSEAPQRIREQASIKQGQPAQTQKSLQKRHENEKKLLEQSLQAERDQVLRQRDNAAKQAANAAERERINREAQAKQQELEKKHAEERVRMQQRHQEEQRNAGMQMKGSTAQPHPKKKG